MTITDRDIAIYALGKTEGIDSIAQTLGKGLDDEKYIESWNKTMGLLGVRMCLEDLEEIYQEFAKKIDAIVVAGDEGSKDADGKNNGGGNGSLNENTNGTMDSRL